MTTLRRAEALRSLALLLALSLDACGGGSAGPSPSDPGAWIVYASVLGSEGAVWAIREDGSGDHLVADGADFRAVTPDGRVVYATPDGNGDLWSVRIDGTDPRVVSATPEQDELAAVGPGGRLVVQTWTAGTGGDLLGVNADGSVPVVLAGTEAEETLLQVAPGGRVLYQAAAGGYRAVRSIALDGTGAVALADAEGVDHSLSAVTPDGHAIVVAWTALGETEVHSVPVAGGAAIPLWVEDGVEKAATGVTANGLVVVEARPTGGSQGDVYVVPADGSAAPRAVAHSEKHEYLAGTTADGRILYALASSELDQDLHLVGADGTGDVAIAPSAAAEFFAGVTGDGRILVGRAAGANRDVLIFDPASGEARPLAATAGNEALAALAGQRLVYGWDDDTTWQLRSVGLDGTGDVLLSDLPGVQLQAVTPAGRVVLGSRVGSDLDLHVADADGTLLRPLATGAPSQFYLGLLP